MAAVSGMEHGVGRKNWEKGGSEGEGAGVGHAMRVVRLLYYEMKGLSDELPARPALAVG